MSGRGGGRGGASRLNSLKAFDSHEPPGGGAAGGRGGDGGRWGGRGGGRGGRGGGRFKKPLNGNFMSRDRGEGGGGGDDNSDAKVGYGESGRSAGLARAVCV